VPGYFVDTSALAKLYHQERGSDYVERILNERSSKGIISRLSLVEFESVLAIKIRTGVLDPAGRTIALRRFRADIAGNRIIVGPPIEEKHFQSATRLLRTHAVDRGLRTLDGIQLAVALDLRQAGVDLCVSLVGSAAMRGGRALWMSGGRSSESWIGSIS
jgi:uncharacterized protein